MRLIPAIDLRGGRCVRLLKGDFAAETRYEAEPLELLARYRGYGADWLHLVDLDGARDGSAGNRPVIATLRNFAAVEDVLDLGAARAVVGSAALTDPQEVRRWLRHFGNGRIALAFDVRLDEAGTPCIATHGWVRQSTLSLWAAVAGFIEAGLIHVLCTDVSRDGALSGPNVALYAEAARRHPQVAWQASGGIRDARDLHALAGCGAAAAISGKALMEERIPIEELGPFLPNA